MTPEITIRRPTLEELLAELTAGAYRLEISRRQGGRNRGLWTVYLVSPGGTTYAEDRTLRDALEALRRT